MMLKFVARHKLYNYFSFWGTPAYLSKDFKYSQVLLEYGRRNVTLSVCLSVNRSCPELEQIWSIWPIMGLFEP